MTRVDARAAQSTDLRWLLLLRVAASLHALVLLWQGITAGQYFSGNDMIDLHGVGAITIHVLSALQLGSAFLIWRATRGPLWPTVLSGYAFVVSFVQAKIGSNGDMALHIPIAITLTLAVAAVVAWAWLSSTQNRLAASR